MISALSGQPIQWAILVTLVTATFGALGIWLKTRPDKMRAENEAVIIHNAESALRFKEFREEVHSYKNQVAKLLAAQVLSDKKYIELEKLLTHALATSGVRRDQMNNMMNLIALLIAEVERIDPKSIIVPQAKALLKSMREASMLTDLPTPDPMKSDALNNAEHAVHDAEQTVRTTVQTVKEVKASEAR